MLYTRHKRNRLPEPPKEKLLALITELEKVTTVVKKQNLSRLFKLRRI